MKTARALPPLSGPTPAPLSSWQATAWLLLAAALWGASFNWNKEGQQRLGELLAADLGAAPAHRVAPLLLLAVRFLLTSLIWVCLWPRSLRQLDRPMLRGGGLAGVIFILALVCQHFGLQTQSEAVVAVLSSLVIVITPLLAVAVLGVRSSRQLWLAIGLATVGSCVLGWGPQGQSSWTGIGLALLSAALLSGHMLAVDRYGRGLDWSAFALVQFAIAGGCSLLGVAAALWTVEAPLHAGRVMLRACVDVEVRGYLIALVLAASVAAYGLMFRYQPRVGAARAVVLYATEPLFAAGFAAMVSERRLSGLVVVGGALVLAGVVLAGVRAPGARKPGNNP